MKTNLLLKKEDLVQWQSEEDRSIRKMKEVGEITRRAPATNMKHFLEEHSSVVAAAAHQLDTKKFRQTNRAFSFPLG